MEQKTRRIVKGILFVASLTGVVVTAVCSAHDTIKAMKKLDVTTKENEDNTVTIVDNIEKKPIKEYAPYVIKATWKCYIPTAVAVAATIGCGVANETISLKTIAGLTALASSLGYRINKYRDKIAEYASPEVLKEIDLDVAEETQEAKANVDAKDDEVIFHDKMTDVWWTGSKLAYSTARYLVNEQFAWGSSVPLEMFYNVQGVELPKEFAECKWDWEDFNDGVIFIGINHEHKKDARKGDYYEITYDQDPI